MLDLAINNGLLVDPVQQHVAPGAIGVEGGRIAVRAQGDLRARTVIDAGGAMVCPGFIDVHGHLDGDAYTGLLSLRQGVILFQNIIAQTEDK